MLCGSHGSDQLVASVSDYCVCINTGCSLRPPFDAEPDVKVLVACCDEWLKLP